jgi:hypothetical protein
MPLRFLDPWIVELGPRMRLSRIAELCAVTIPFARRYLRRVGYERLIWDDGDHRSRSPGAAQLPLADPLLAEFLEHTENRP